MRKRRRRKCLHCGDLFRPDPRNRWHQRYCDKTVCRKASKQASQRRWRSKPANRDYFKGAVHVQRVQAWRRAHPGYWRRSGSALQDDSLTQVIDNTEKSQDLAGVALQDLLSAQPFVLIGLIANLTGSALQEDIAQTGRRLQHLGQDIVAGANGGDHAKTPDSALKTAPGPAAVQLGGSTPGA